VAQVTLIAAVASNGAIGKDNHLLWQLPEDMQRFKALTLGHVVLMGRKTWESLPVKFRPLPGRRNIVVSRNSAYQALGATVVLNLNDAISAAANESIFVIGGAEIYKQALLLSDRLELTEVDDDPAGDAFFPALDHQHWKEIAREPRLATATAPAYAFVTYERATQST
jgi:dihydrofolate reductase